VWHVVVCGQGVSNEAYISETSSDDVCLSALKAVTDQLAKSEDSPSCVKDDKNNDDQFASVSVKVEPQECSDGNCRAAAENGTSVSCVKVESENSTAEVETVGVKIKDEELDGEKLVKSTTEQQLASEAISNRDSSDGVEETQQSCSDVAVSDSVSDVCQSDLHQPSDKLENVCSKTAVDSSIVNDSCEAVAEAASVNVGNVNNEHQTDDSNVDNSASDTVSKTPCQQVRREKNCSTVTASTDSEHGDQEHSTVSPADSSVATESKCSSPQRSKKLASKQGKVSPSESPGR